MLSFYVLIINVHTVTFDFLFGKGYVNVCMREMQITREKAKDRERLTDATWNHYVSLCPRFHSFVYMYHLN